MTNASIKIVWPWPAEQPRLPVTHRTDRISVHTERQRPPRVKSAAAQAVADVSG